ncbi:MAG: DNA recombination protein RmuC [Gammaproteobacteria bacterium]
MNGLDSLSWIIVAGIGGFAFGALLIWAIAQRREGRLRNRVTTLEAQIEIDNRLHEERLAALERTKQQLSDSFAAISREALSKNNQAFLDLAAENLKGLQQQARAELDKKEKGIENLVNPIRETLQKTEQQIREIEKERKQSYGSLSELVKQMNQSNSALQRETQNLVNALRRPEVRGQWGEMTLKRLAELAGMVEYCDFFEQESRDTEEGRMRPDMIVRMPDQRELVVDAKTPLDAYLNAVGARDEEERKTYLRQHARKVRDRMKELASKAYWAQFPRSPDYVVLFIPGDQFLSAALEQDPALLEDALNNQVILATPTSIIALLRAVAFGWRQQAIAENAEQIRGLGEDLYKRLSVFAGHLSLVGKGLTRSVDSYNKAVGSLERSVMPGARRFTELGIQARKPIEPPARVEEPPRQLDVADPDE